MKKVSNMLWLGLTVGVNSFLNQSSSLIWLMAGRPPILLLRKSGTCVVEWFPQMATRLTLV